MTDLESTLSSLERHADVIIAFAIVGTLLVYLLINALRGD